VASWEWLATQYAHVELVGWIVMPNHLHGIVVIHNDGCAGGSRTAPTKPTTQKPLGRLIGAFKTVSTKRINALRGSHGMPVWQRNYYEHIIRDESELNCIREYVINNPAGWDKDEENPAVANNVGL